MVASGNYLMVILGLGCCGGFEEKKIIGTKKVIVSNMWLQMIVHLHCHSLCQLL